MPQAIITAIVFVGTLIVEALPVLEIIFGLNAAFIVGPLAVVGGIIGLSKLMEIDLPRPDSNYARQKTVRSTTAPVKRVYGESLVSGPVAFLGVSGTDNQDLWHVIALTGDKSESITDIYLDNIIIPNADINSGNSAGGVVNGTSTVFGPSDGTNITTIYKYIGSQTQASGQVSSEFLKWTADHKGQGLTYIATKFSFPSDERIAEIWNKYNPQDIKALVKGMAIYDPRKDSTSTEYDSSLGVSTHRLSDETTWQWSDNPALCLANYIIDDEFGMGIHSSVMDWASVHSAADYCDALVSIPGSQTQKRFTCNGVLYGTDSHSQNVSKILSSMNGSLVYSSGRYVMQAGQYIAPESDAILTDDDLNGAINISIANSRNERFNTIKGTHFNPSDLHKKVAFPEVQLTDISTRDAGEVLYKEVELPMTNDVYMCQRLMYQLINRSNDQMTIEFPCNLKALRYSVGDRVKITLPNFAGSENDSISFNETPFVILGFNFSGESAVTLTLLKDTQANYADMPVDNYSSIASDGSITDGFSGVPAPSNLDSIVNGHDVRLTWDNPVPNTLFNDIIVYQSDTSNFSESSILFRTKGDALTFVLPSSGMTKYYWVRASLYDNEVDATDIIIGQTYRIRSLGTTNWTNLGASSPVSNGDTFVATANGTSSSGTGVATDESAVSAVVGPETVTTTDQVADSASSVEWIDVDNTDNLRPDNNATVGATLGTDVFDGQAQAYAVGDLLNSNGFFRFTRTSADDNVDAPADASAFNTAFGRNPTDGDIVVVTNTASTPDKQAAYQYNGSTFATISGFFAGDLIIDDTITAAAISVDDLGAINANLGTITGGTLKGGTVPDADAAPSGTESGSFFDLTGGKFVVGDATNNLLFDGSSLSVTGTVNASAGAFTGDVSTDAKFIAGSNSSTVTLDGTTGANYSIFAGADNSLDASFKVASDGVVEATRFIIRDDANGQVLIDTSNTANPFSGVVYTSISQGSGAGVDTVAGTLANNAGEITITTTQAETFLITAKVAIDDNDGSTNNISGASTVSTTDAENQLKGADLKIEYYLKEGAGAYALEDTEIVTFTEGTPSSSQIKVFGVDRGAGYSGSLTRYFAVIQSGGAAEFVTYFSTSSNANRARTYAVTTASISISGAGTHKIKILARLVDAGTNTTLTNSTTPALVNNNATGTYGGSGIVLDAAQSPPNQSSLDNFKRIYEATSANGFVVSAANTFAIGEGTTILTSGGTISGNLVITGDLTVSGTTTTVNTDNLTVKDNNITLNYSTGDSSSTANNAGITIQDAVSAETDASLIWKTASDSFEFSHTLAIAGSHTNGISLKLRSGDGSTGTDSTQINFGYNNEDNYSHRIVTRHNATNDHTNAIDFYVWDTSLATGALATKRALIIDGFNDGLVYAPQIGVGTTDKTVLANTQVYIKKHSANLNLMRWGEGDVSNQDSYRIRIDQYFKFITNSGSGDTLTIDSSNGNIDSTGVIDAGSLEIGGVPVITSARKIEGVTFDDSYYTDEFGKSLVGNFGQFQDHAAYGDFNTAVSMWGWNYVNNGAAMSGNAPVNVSRQWYRNRVALGDVYGYGNDSTDYWLEMAYPRYGNGTTTSNTTTQLSKGSLWVRTFEGGTYGSWSQIGSDLYNGLSIRNTPVIDSSRNLTNIGTISSGAITATGDGAALTVYSATNAAGVRIQFSDQSTAAQKGYLTYYHADTASYGSGNSFVFDDTEGSLSVFVDGKILSKDGYYVGPASGTGSGTLVIDASRNITAGTISSGAITAGTTSSASSVRVHDGAGNYATMQGYGIEFNRSASYLRPTADGTMSLYIGAADASKDWNTIYFRSNNGLILNGTQFISAGGNLTNIGTISSGAITSTGAITGASFINTAVRYIANQIQSGYGDNSDNSDIWINYTGYQGGTTYFRDFRVGNGKQVQLFFVDGSAGSVSVTNDLTVGGTTSSGGITSSGRIDISSSNSISEPYAALGITNTSTSAGLFLHASNGGRKYEIQSTVSDELIFYDRNSSAYRLRIMANGNLKIETGNLQMGGTSVIDSSRNITNVNITASGYISQATSQSHYFRGGTDGNWRIGSDIVADSGGLVNSAAIQMIVGGGASPNYGFQIFGHTTNTDPVFEVLPQANAASSITNIRGKLYINNTEVIDNSKNITAGTIIAGSNYSPTGTVIGGVRAYGNINAYVSASDQSGRTAFFGVDTSGYAMFGALTNHDAVIRANNTEYLRVKTNSNVQIVSGSLQMGSTPVIDNSRNLTNINLVKFREGSSSFYISPTNANTLNADYGSAADSGDMWINYRGYQDGWTYFRDLRIGNGKGTPIVHVDGSVPSMNLQNNCSLKVDGLIVISGSRQLQNVTFASALYTVEYGPSVVGNFGQFQAHSTYSSGFNASVAMWGWNYVQGNANGPNTSSNQWYRNRVSLGNAYGYNYDSGDYWLEMAYPRYNQTTAGHLWLRTCENGNPGGWTQVGANIIGNFTATGNVTAYSDERLKDNIKTLDGSKVLQMRGVSFTKDGKAGSGVIAQELEQIASELVHTSDDEMGTKSVAYGNLVGYLIENAKQQQSEIDELKALVKQLMEK